MNPDSYLLRLKIADWYLQQTAANYTFPQDVLLTDKTTFTRRVCLTSINPTCGVMITYMTQ